jgi:hypothetical protein
MTRRTGLKGSSVDRKGDLASEYALGVQLGDTLKVDGRP